MRFVRRLRHVCVHRRRRLAFGLQPARLGLRRIRRARFRFARTLVRCLRRLFFHTSPLLVRARSLARRLARAPLTRATPSRTHRPLAARPLRHGLARLLRRLITTHRLSCPLTHTRTFGRTLCALLGRALRCATLFRAALFRGPFRSARLAPAARGLCACFLASLLRCATLNSLRRALALFAPLHLLMHIAHQLLNSLRLRLRRLSLTFV